ncbi:MAG: hypothetical protein H6713_27975 [Myxococcales bacterium]|nr:hypothetical protein [Myxococcales bacterium]
MVMEYVVGRTEDANLAETFERNQLNIGAEEGGSRLASSSSFGQDDMLGNAAEWVSSSLNDGEVMIRGGGFFFDQINGVAPNRGVVTGDYRDPQIGFRVCASYPLTARPVTSTPSQARGIGVDEKTNSSETRVVRRR